MSQRPYPYDPDIRALVAARLYELLPELYRVQDQPPRGEAELLAFFQVLAAPLAVVRQNIEELYADLFIDSCNDWVIPYLADMVGTTLVFPDAESNRQDVRGTVSWRRRKGAPAMLEEMSAELTGTPVTSHEGWKRLLLAQDLNLLRHERRIANVRDALLAETATGPLDAAFHAVDLRTISEHTGRYHPRHMIHWIHPTRYFPLANATPAAWTKPYAGTQDLRYAFHPLGHMVALGARRTSAAITTDTVPPIHFKAHPEAFFGNAEAYFDVRVCGLSAAVSGRVATTRTPSSRPAEAVLVEGPVTISLISFTARRLTGPVRIEVMAAAVNGVSGLPSLPGPVRGALELTAGGATPDPGSNPAAISAPVAVLRLAAVSGQREYFPGAVVELAGAELAGARRASSHPHLAVEGFLRGALVVELPALWLEPKRLLYVAADGSVYDAEPSGVLAPLVFSQADSAWHLPGPALVTGPGPAWPPPGVSASTERVTRVPTAPGRGPVFMHGGSAVIASGPASQHQLVPGSTAVALVFAAYRIDNGSHDYQPFLRLLWQGHNPKTATWHAVATSGAPTALRARFEAIAALRSQTSLELGLHVRLEAGTAGVILPPCEIAIATDDGTPVLVHLPELVTQSRPSGDPWQSPLSSASSVVKVMIDGSTQAAHSTQARRYSHGAIAPLASPVTVRFRTARYRALCPWKNETNVLKHQPTPPGFLDIDPGFGLFAMAALDPPQPYPAETGSPGSLVPASVTVAYQEGYTDHTGARPAPREPELDAAQPIPTRLVCGHGVLHRHASAALHAIPRYPTLAAALAAIDQEAQPGQIRAAEVIQIEDSATYNEPLPLWPRRLATLVIQAAEGERPVVRFAQAAPAQPESEWAWQAVTLRGLCLELAPGVANTIMLPPLERAELQFCTAASLGTKLVFRAPATAATRVSVHRCVTAALELTGTGTLAVTDSVVDAGQGNAITAPAAGCHLARVTVRGRTTCMTLEATEVIFLGDLEVTNRFTGCVRYSRVTAASKTPRRHRVYVAASGDADARVVTWDRTSPAHGRLSAQASGEIRRGAEDGSEMGAFHSLHTAQRYEGLIRRLVEYTPAGLITGTIRVD